MGAAPYGISPEVMQRIAGELKEVVSMGVQLALVVGGGNIFRGVAPAADGMDRATADYMGMLATVINALSLGDMLERNGAAVRVMSALPIEGVVEPFVRRRALAHLERGRVVVFAAGTGNPYFTTDTAASLRAVEVGADIVIKATKVDGVYDKDPIKHGDAKRFDRLSYDEVLEKRLAVMDATAIALCRDNNMPLRVLNLNAEGALVRAMKSEEEGTIITGG